MPTDPLNPILNPFPSDYPPLVFDWNPNGLLPVGDGYWYLGEEDSFLFSVSSYFFYMSLTLGGSGA